MLRVAPSIRLRKATSASLPSRWMRRSWYLDAFGRLIAPARRRDHAARSSGPFERTTVVSTGSGPCLPATLRLPNMK